MPVIYATQTNLSIINVSNGYTKPLTSLYRQPCLQAAHSPEEVRPVVPWKSSSLLPRQALPFGARPLSGAMLVFTQISSMNTDRRGSIRPQWRRRRSRRRFTSARSHLSATSVFLENQPAAAQKTSDSIVPHLAPALRQHLLQHGRRIPHPIQQPTPMRLQNRAAIPAHLRRPHRAGPRRAARSLHFTMPDGATPNRSAAR